MIPIRSNASSNTHLRARKVLTVLLFLSSFLSASICAAQTVTMTGPSTNSTVKEGDEFFTDVLNDPIDFDKRRDLSWDALYVDPGVTVTNNQWIGTTTGSAYVYLLYMGYLNIVNLKPFGAINPIATTKYKAVSGLSRINSQTARSQKLLYWSRDYTGPTGTGLNVAKIDGYTTNSTTLYHPANRWVMDNFDLSGNASWTAAPVTALAFDESVAAPAGTQESFQWFRVYDPTTGTTLAITWSYSAMPLIAGGTVTPKANIYADTDGGGLDGFFVDRVPINNLTGSGLINGTGLYNLNTASLPPGTYRFYVIITDAFDDLVLMTKDKVLATSGYSSALQVNSKARMTFTSPSYTSGEDYASTVLSNPWDMNDQADVQNLGFVDDLRHWRSPVFNAGVFSATAYLAAGRTESDAQVWLNTDLGASHHKIDTLRYRYLTYKYTINPAGFGDITDKVARGWVVRLIWWDLGAGADGSVSADVVTFDDDRSYSIDMTTIPLAPPGGIPQVGWRGTASRKVSVFRFDPCEVPQDTIFNIEDVKLTADPEATTGSYAIRFALQDLENLSATIEFFRDNNKTGFDGTSIGSGAYVPGTNLLNWNTAAVANGTYYIYAVVTDSESNVFKFYADVPVIVRNAQAVTRYRLYNPFTGDHHYTTSLTEYNALPAFGWVQEGGTYSLYTGAFTVGGVTSVPYYRLYNAATGWHHWTVDVNEYNALAGVGWIQEGPDGYIFRSSASGLIPLYRLYNPFSGFHHWTIDANEYSALAGIGWVQEGIGGYVVSGPSFTEPPLEIEEAGRAWLAIEHPGVFAPPPSDRTRLNR